MIKVKHVRFLPNLITLSSLLCGCLGAVWAFELKMQWAVYMIWTCAALDLMDGLVARSLGISSDLGKQLDSLSDLISFGLLPAAVIYSLSSGYLHDPWPYASFIVTVFSALRLARFNLDTDQNIDFKGLPTPANALLISSFPALIDQNSDNLRHGLENPVLWVLIIGLLSYLLVSRIPLFGFKFQNLRWADNKFRYLFIGISAIALLALGTLAIPVIIVLYLTTSVIWQYHRR